MISAQAVALHAAAMDSLGRAMHAGMSDAVVIKYRSNAVQLGRSFSLMVRDLERRQSKPLLERPKAEPPTPPSDPPLNSGPPPGDHALGETKPPQVAPGETVAAFDDIPAPDDTPEWPEDMVTRPDGTPGSLTAYAPRPPEVVYIPREPAIMVALATRGKPWRIVDHSSAAPEPSADTIGATEPDPVPERTVTRGPLDLTEKMFTGDALARFASTRFDPDAPVELPCFDHEDSVVELEMISTGGDPEAEAERAAMMAAHPEGKPIVTFRYGTQKPPERKADDG